MAGEEVFGSQKRKANVPLGFEGESHRPDKVNFSRPRIQTRSSRAKHASCNLPDVVEELSLDLQEDQVHNNQGTTTDVGRAGHVTSVHETACKETEWSLQGCPRPQQRLALPSKQSQRRSARPGLFRATNQLQPRHTLALCKTLTRRG